MLSFCLGLTWSFGPVAAAGGFAASGGEGAQLKNERLNA
jgi:hypothetical protein